MTSKMKIKTLISSIAIIMTNLSLSQIDYTQNTNITVIKNTTELINPWAGGMNFCQFSNIDLNMDGENDLFVFDKSGKNGTTNGNRIIPFVLNTNSNFFEYAPEYIDKFPELSDWVLLLDYNGDLKADIFTSYNSSIAVYTNTSQSELSFEFTKIITSDAGFGQTNVYVSSSDIPAIIDVDNDTDIDILTFDPTGTHVYLHENKSMQMYGNNDSLNMVRSDNCWGRFKEDFSTNSVTLNLNSDCQEDEEEQRIAHSGSTILAIDLDPSNNQGMELLLGDITYDNMVMLFNGGTEQEALITAQDLNFPSYNSPINLTRFPAAFHIDVDHDNLKDIIISPNGVNVSENYKNTMFYKNIGPDNNNSLQFDFIENDFMIKDMIDVGTNAQPVLFDLNNDNLLDLIIGNKGYFDNGNYNSSISIYKNIGTLTNPMFEFITEDFSNLSSILGSLPGIQSLHPTFGDLNNDGKVDMIIGDNNGELYYFENTDEDDNGDLFPEWPFYSSYTGLNIDVGSFATPQLIDLNRDGLLDLIIGERMGIDNGVYNGINYYQNNGSVTNHLFEDYTPELPSDDNTGIIIKSLGGVHLSDPTYLTAYTSPSIFEYNDTYYLAIGTESGFIYLYSDIENIINGENSLNLETEYNLITNNILELNNCVHSKVTIGDLNNDNLPDLIKGNASGGLELFFATNFNVNSIQNINSSVQITPNPNNGLFKIQTPTDMIYSAIIYSNIGQPVFMKKNLQGPIQINKNHLLTGMYILVLESDNEIITKKIIIH